MKKITFSHLLLLSLFLLLTGHHGLTAMKTRSKDKYCQDALEPATKKQKTTPEQVIILHRSQKTTPALPIPKVRTKKKLFSLKKYFFECEICRKSLSSNNALKYHLMAHKDIKPHECGCGKAYTQKGNLKKHMERCSQKKENHVSLSEMLDESDLVFNPQLDLELDVEQYLNAPHHMDDLDINNL